MSRNILKRAHRSLAELFSALQPVLDSIEFHCLTVRGHDATDKLWDDAAPR